MATPRPNLHTGRLVKIRQKNSQGALPSLLTLLEAVNGCMVSPVLSTSLLFQMERSWSDHARPFTGLLSKAGAKSLIWHYNFLITQCSPYLSSVFSWHWSLTRSALATLFSFHLVCWAMPLHASRPVHSAFFQSELLLPKTSTWHPLLL